MKTATYTGSRVMYIYCQKSSLPKTSYSKKKEKLFSKEEKIKTKQDCKTEIDTPAPHTPPSICKFYSFFFFFLLHSESIKRVIKVKNPLKNSQYNNIS